MKKLNVLLLLILSTTTNVSVSQVCTPTISESTPISRFLVYSNLGLVKDKTTKLMWKRCVEGKTGQFCTGTANLFTWQEALLQADLVSTRKFARYNNWRLPNLKELLSITEVNCEDPGINSTVFPATPPAVHWTSTAFKNAIYIVDFFGYAPIRLVNALSPFGPYNVRLVRTLAPIVEHENRTAICSTCHLGALAQGKNSAHPQTANGCDDCHTLDDWTGRCDRNLPGCSWISQ